MYFFPYGLIHKCIVLNCSKKQTNRNAFKNSAAAHVHEEKNRNIGGKNAPHVV